MLMGLLSSPNPNRPERMRSVVNPPTVTLGTRFCSGPLASIAGVPISIVITAAIRSAPQTMRLNRTRLHFSSAVQVVRGSCLLVVPDCPPGIPGIGGQQTQQAE